MKITQIKFILDLLSQAILEGQDSARQQGLVQKLDGDKGPKVFSLNTSTKKVSIKETKEEVKETKEEVKETKEEVKEVKETKDATHSKADLAKLTKVQLVEFAEKNDLKIKKSAKKASIVEEILSQLK